jgi:catechol 2,3-dioxygenase-like lactoylglutathione lyase family enzyme
VKTAALAAFELRGCMYCQATGVKPSPAPSEAATDKENAMTQPSPVFELRVVLTAENYDAAVRFWRDVVGLPLIRDFPGPGGGGSLLAAGQATLEIVAREQAAAIDTIEVGRQTGAGPLRLALEVADSAELAAELEEGGAERLGGPVDTPWKHRNVRMRTPEGVQVTLFTVLPPDGA